MTVTNPISQAEVDAFAKGIYFAFEDLTTAPAQLTITATTSAHIILHEGRYHQIKRMFGHFRNPVLSIHRTQVGAIKLPANLPAGGYRVVSDPLDF